MKLTNCRICSSPDLSNVLDLGEMPLANEFLDSPTEEEKEYPLRVVWCQNCGLMQIDEVVPPEELFSEYVYVSGTSERLQNHFNNLVSEIDELYSTLNGRKVLDIGSNDGTLLKGFENHDYDVIGVEPASNIAEIARENGVETINEFFNEEVAFRIQKNYGRRDVITATNVFAHTHNVHSFLKGVSKLLADDGIFVIEVPYLVDLLENVEFDTIYHEHLSYFAVRPLKTLLEKHGFKILNIKRIDIHGGSIRLYSTKDSSWQNANSSAKKLIRIEMEKGLDELATYKSFAHRVERLKTSLLDLLSKLKGSGHTIAGYGAAAKGNTLLNYYSIGQEMLEYIADQNTLKQGLYTPGTHVKVVSPNRIYQDTPDEIVILAWNFAEEIMKQQSDFKEMGGRFVLPVPEVRVI